MKWLFIPVNPEPWRVPPMFTAKRNGRFIVTAGRDDGLYSFQEAVRECLGDPAPLDGPIRLHMFFMRQLPSYTTESEREHTKHVADLTNMQKALEDALQGYLFHNDRQVVAVVSHVVEQLPTTPPGIFVGVEEYNGKIEGPPPEMWGQYAMHSLNDNGDRNDNSWPPSK